MLAKGSGSWLSHIEFDGLLYWKNVEQTTICGLPKILLPSDSRVREDRKLLIEGKLPEAQKVKIALETQEKADCALRQIAQENFLKRTI